MLESNRNKASRIADTHTSPIVLELIVQNHPGTMSHICGLFSRRAFNLDGILCIPIGDGTLSRVSLRIDRPGRIDQIHKQLDKLHDVLEVRQHEAGHDRPVEAEQYFSAAAPIG